MEPSSNSFDKDKDVSNDSSTDNVVIENDSDDIEANNKNDISLGTFPKVIELIEYREITILILIPFSIIGVLIRIGFRNLFAYPGAPVFYLIYPQFVGCIIMGICLERKELIMESYLPLYTGLTTGLCGSITTFSSWMLIIFLDFINNASYSRSGFFDLMAGVADIVITIGMSLIGLKLGRHLADVIVPHQKAPVGLKYRIIQKSSEVKEFSFLDWSCVMFSLASLIIVVTLASTIKVHRAILFATVFAPLGTLCRWQLSRFNHFKGYFPFGTFYANVLGSLILATLYLLAGGVVYMQTACDVITGLIDGFCGCLTTVSTFTAEISTLKRQHAYVYAVVSIVTGQIGMILIVGIYHWTVGLTPTCN